MYTYRKNSGTYGDFSNTQYGVLGVWYAAMAGLEVPNNYWRLVEDCWRSGQGRDGGWGYTPMEHNTYASMTAAGAATLYITYDYVHSPEEVRAKQAPWPRTNSRPPTIVWPGAAGSIRCCGFRRQS